MAFISYSSNCIICFPPLLCIPHSFWRARMHNILTVIVVANWIDFLQYSRHCTKCFLYIISFNPHSSAVKEALFPQQPDQFFRSQSKITPLPCSEPSNGFSSQSKKTTVLPVAFEAPQHLPFPLCPLPCPLLHSLSSSHPTSCFKHPSALPEVICTCCCSFGPEVYSNI